MSADSFDSLKSRIQDYERLFDTMQLICSSMDVDVVVQRILDEAIDLCRADHGSIVLFEKQSGQFAKTLVRGGEKPQSALDHHLNILLSGLICEQKKPLLTESLQDVFGRQPLKEKHRQITSVLSTPLLTRGMVIGVINLSTVQKDRKLGPRELHLMQILASQCTQFIINAKMHEELFAEASRLRKEVEDKYSFHGIIGTSPIMLRLFALLERVIPTDGRVLIEGESGTGKELIARALHYNGPRKNKPFVAVDCAALPANLLESELFGYVKGAFTGAIQDKKGLFDEADGGTLFLDEITSMPLEMQGKLLRAIQEGEIRPVGSTKMKKVDVRIIAAASRDLRADVATGSFREDLFYRLHIVSLKLPPLRERREDLALLAQHLLMKISPKYQKHLQGFSPEIIKVFENHPWPGNVRELENVIERMVILAGPDLEVIPPELVPEELSRKQPDTHHSAISLSPAASIDSEKKWVEKRALCEILKKHQWNQSAAAKELGIHESTLRYKMKKLGIQKES